MPDLIDRLGRASFDGVEIPFLGYSLRGGQRKKLHQYPHTDGAKPEKLGRENYVVNLTPFFDTSLDQLYPTIYPDVLNALLKKFEAGITGPLYLPTRGTIRCFCDGWTIEMSSKVRSGEAVSLTFCEDSEAGFDINDFTVFFGKDFYGKSLTLFELEARYAADMTEPNKSLFAQIDAAVNEVRGALDLAEARVQFVANKIERLTNLCAEVEERVTVAKSARGWPLLEATKELWASAKSAGASVAAKNVIDTFTVPVRMAISQVSTAIFGDATHSASLLDLNFFDDAFAIPAGTNIFYYAT